jgi:hypothetical protein
VTDEPPLDDLTLADVLAAAAEDLPGVRSETDGVEVTYRFGPAVFAVVAGSRAEFRLDPAVVAAALRTPETGPSARGSDWVAFGPAVLDDPAVDRAESWFLSAHRRVSRRRTD